MFDPIEWLERELPNGQKISQRLCFLVVSNGGFDVIQWGVMSYDRGHQSGLDMDDAIELIQLRYFMDGLEIAGIPVYASFKPYYDAYIAETRKDHAENQDADIS